MGQMVKDSAIIENRKIQIIKPQGHLITVECISNLAANQILTVLAGALTPIAKVSVENKTYRKNREVSKACISQTTDII